MKHISTTPDGAKSMKFLQSICRIHSLLTTRGLCVQHGGAFLSISSPTKVLLFVWTEGKYEVSGMESHMTPKTLEAIHPQEYEVRALSHEVLKRVTEFF